MKLLILSTSSFPLGYFEPLLVDQIDSLSKCYDKIIIIQPNSLNTSLKFEIPTNVEVIQISSHLNSIQKIKGILWLTSKYVRDEIKSLIRTKEFSISHLKVLLNSFTLAMRSRKKIDSILSKTSTTNDKVYFRSYWCTEVTIGALLVKKKYSNFIVTTRMHAFDLYFERHNPNYLPYRNFIISKIDKIFFITAQGVQYFTNKFNIQSPNVLSKLVLNRLGVTKKNEEFKSVKNIPGKLIHLVSCSSIIELKRIQLIIETLSKIADLNIRWSHIGEGKLQNSIIELCKIKLECKKNIEFSFLGFLPNSKVKEFYEGNQVDLFVNTSKYEGLPISMMEAMSYGIPCIGTDVGGVSEIIDDNNGFLLPVDFDNQLVDIIYDFYNLSIEKREELSENAFKTWKTKFNGKSNFELLQVEMDNC